MKMNNVYGIVIYLLYRVKYLPFHEILRIFTDLTQKLHTTLKIFHTSYAVIYGAITDTTSTLHVSFHMLVKYYIITTI